MSQPRRDWKSAREKVEREGYCRASGTGWQLAQGPCVGLVEAAHIIGREHDKETLNTPDSEVFAYSRGQMLSVAPVRIVPLCRRHHKMYDAHELDLLGYLTPEEEAQAVLDAGSLESARRRLAPSEYRKAVA